MYQIIIPTERNHHLQIALEPSTICNFNELQTPYYSSRVLRGWSAQWVPSYVWSHDGLIADPIVVSLFHQLIVIPNSHTLFQVVDGSYMPIQSYCSQASQEYHRYLYPSFHSLKEDSAKANQCEHERITSPNRTLNFILLWHADHSNYWHFTFDIAFRVFYMVSVFPELISRIRLVVVGCNSLSKYQNEILEAILGRKPLIYFSPNSALIESAIYIPPIQTLLARKDWLVSYSRFLSSHLIPNLNEGLDGDAGDSNGFHQQKTLYIQRGKTKNPRALLNESEVIRTLEKQRFSVCDPGVLSVHEQAHLFHSADLVIGPHGSAFVNILYMKPGSGVIEFTNSSYDPFHDFFLSRQLNVLFIRIRQNDGRLQSSDFTSSHRPFRIDVGKVSRALSLMTASNLAQ